VASLIGDFSSTDLSDTATFYGNLSCYPKARPNGYSSAKSQTAHSAVPHGLATLTVAPVDESMLLTALAMQGADFEDHLQIACAVQGGVDAIVTRDPQGFACAPIPVLAPSALVALLPLPPNP
jgi:hypothetical protein